MLFILTYIFAAILLLILGESFLTEYTANDKISAAARMSDSQSEVARKKHFILLPQKRMELVRIFCHP